MEERPAASQFVLEVRKLPTATGVLIIPASNLERNPITRGYNNARRPNFNLQFDGNTELQESRFIMRMIRPPRFRQRRVKLSMRGTQPALADRRMRINRTLECNFLQVGRENSEHGKNIGVFGAR
jgi:hypothetical protein